MIFLYTLVYKVKCGYRRQVELGRKARSGFLIPAKRYKNLQNQVDWLSKWDQD